MSASSSIRYVAFVGVQFFLVVLFCQSFKQNMKQIVSIIMFYTKMISTDEYKWDSLPVSSNSSSLLSCVPLKNMVIPLSGGTPASCRIHNFKSITFWWVYISVILINPLETCLIQTSFGICLSSEKNRVKLFYMFIDQINCCWLYNVMHLQGAISLNYNSYKVLYCFHGISTSTCN